MPFPSTTLFPSETLYPGTPFEPIDGLGHSEFPIDITDEFSYPQGRWYHYDAVPEIQKRALRNQRHVNIRSFVDERRSSEVTMLFMDRLTMYDLDDRHLADFSIDSISPARIVVQENERWTNGTVKKQSDRNHWNGISVVCNTSVSNLTTTQSVILV